MTAAGKSILTSLPLVGEFPRNEFDVREAGALASEPAVLDALDLYIGLMMPEGVLLQANESALRDTGLLASECLGRDFSDLPCWQHSAATRERLVIAIARAAAGETVRYDTDMSLASGAVASIELTIRPLLDDEGCVVSLVPSATRIEQRLAVEEQLRTNEQHLENAIRHAKLTICNLDREFRYTWTRNLPGGLCAADLIGRTPADIFPPEEAALVLHMAQSVMETGVGTRAEAPLTLPDGKGWFALTIEPLFDRGGIAGGVTCTITDITNDRAERDRLRTSADEHRIAAEIGREALKSESLPRLFELATRRMREALDFDVVAVFENDAASGTFSAVTTAGSEEIAAILGRRVPELLRSAAFNGDAFVMGDLLAESQSGERPLARVGIRSVAVARIRGVASEAAFGVIAACSRKKYAFQGESLAFIRSVANVLSAAISRARAEEALARQRNELHLLVDGTPDVIARFTPDLRLLFANRKFWWCGDADPGDAVGRRLDELMMSAPDCCAAWLDGLNAAVATRRPSQFVVRCGSRVDEVRVVPELAADGAIQALLIVARDVSAQHEAERNREQLMQQLQAAERLSSLGELAASMAHEFNNVLMAISPFAEYFRRTFHTNKQVAEAADHVTSAIARGKRITSEVLRYARPSDPSFTRVAAATMLRKLAMQFRESLPKWLAIEVDVEDESLAVEADPAQIEQVLTNLILNARDAIADHGTIGMSVRACRGAGDYRFGYVPEPSRYVHIEVRDDGPGIPPEALGRVLEPFFTTKRGGTGLGLAIADQIVKRHEGFFFVENDGGAVFHIFLRRDGGDAADVIADAAPAVHAFATAVVVEDDPAVGDGLVTLLDLIGIEATIVRTAAGAIDTIARVSPNVVLLDVSLPDASGLDVHRDIAARWPRLPVVFSTGHGDDALFQQFAQDRNVRCLMKPYSIDTLEATLADLGRG